MIGVTGRVAFRDVFTDVTLGSGWNADWRTYAPQDANGDVVALVGNAAFVGIVRERYAYSPYGVASILDASGSSFAWRQLFQGGRLDAATGLYVFGFRDDDPAAGVWMQRDPIGLAGGDANLYRFTVNNPVNGVAPSGLAGQSWSDWASEYYRSSRVLSATGAFAGATVDTVAGLVDGAMSSMARPFGVRTQGRGPFFGNQDSFDRGHTVGDAGSTLVQLGTGAAGLMSAAAAAGAGLGSPGLTVASGGVLASP